MIANSLNPEAVEAESMVKGEGEIDECRVLIFKDDAAEAKKLASMIRVWIDRDHLSPRGVCVLCRMKPPVYSEALRAALETQGIRSRIENEMQDLLSEPLTECIIDFIRLSCREHEPEAWARTVSLLGGLRGESSEQAMGKVIDALLNFLKDMKYNLSHASESVEEVERTLSDVMHFVGEVDFKEANPQYLQGTWYGELKKKLATVLAEARMTRDWSGAIDEVVGIESVPIMTTHKSKGLEFHTVIFVGLEDDALFSFSRSQNEETCGFFVALSRAMKRVVFTFAEARPKQVGGNRVVQSRDALHPLYDLLKQAGIQIEDGPTAVP